MRYKKQEIKTLDVSIITQAIDEQNGVRCNKEDFDKIIDFIDKNTGYQFIAKSSHKEDFDFYVTFGEVHVATQQTV